MLIDFSDSDFESKVKNEDVSILQFSAAWCGPCKVLKPIMEKLSDEFKDKANFYYADIDEKAINSASAAAVFSSNQGSFLLHALCENTIIFGINIRSN